MGGEGDRASAREEKEQRVREAKKAFSIDEQRKLYPVSVIRNGSLYTLLLVRAISSPSSSSFLLQFVTVHHQNKALEEGNRNGEKRRERERRRGNAREEEKEKENRKSSDRHEQNSRWFPFPITIINGSATRGRFRLGKHVFERMPTRVEEESSIDNSRRRRRREEATKQKSNCNRN